MHISPSGGMQVAVGWLASTIVSTLEIIATWNTTLLVFDTLAKMLKN